VTVKVKYADFSQASRARTLKHPTNATRAIYETARALLEEMGIARPLRLIGVGVSHFSGAARQGSLLPDPKLERERHDAAIDAALDAVRQKFGKNAIVRGALFQEKG
jgi:DNA polymerase-4